MNTMNIKGTQHGTTQSSTNTHTHTRIQDDTQLLFQSRSQSTLLICQKFENYFVESVEKVKANKRQAYYTFDWMKIGKERKLCLMNGVKSQTKKFPFSSFLFLFSGFVYASWSNSFLLIFKGKIFRQFG